MPRHADHGLVFCAVNPRLVRPAGSARPPFALLGRAAKQCARTRPARRSCHQGNAADGLPQQLPWLTKTAVACEPTCCARGPTTPLGTSCLQANPPTSRGVRITQIVARHAHPHQLQVRRHHVCAGQHLSHGLRSQQGRAGKHPSANGWHRAGPWGASGANAINRSETDSGHGRRPNRIEDSKAPCSTRNRQRIVWQQGR